MKRSRRHQMLRSYRHSVQLFQFYFKARSVPFQTTRKNSYLEWTLFSGFQACWNMLLIVESSTCGEAHSCQCLLCSPPLQFCCSPSLYSLFLQCHLLRGLYTLKDIIWLHFTLLFHTFVFLQIFIIDTTYVLASAANDESCTVTAAFKYTLRSGHVAACSKSVDNTKYEFRNQRKKLRLSRGQ